MKGESKTMASTCNKAPTRKKAIGAGVLAGLLTAIMAGFLLQLAFINTRHFDAILADLGIIPFWSTFGLLLLSPVFIVALLSRSGRTIKFSYAASYLLVALGLCFSPAFVFILYLVRPVFLLFPL